jgi:hypothetical protein
VSQDLYTLKQMAKLSLDIQNACNLSGVVHSFSLVCSSLRRLPETEGTQATNQHPVVTLFLSKLCSLNRTEGPTCEEFGKAYDWAMEAIDE